MKDLVDKEMTLFLESKILPLFPLPEGIIEWHGSGEASTESTIHYLSLDGNEYFILLENYDGASDEITGNLIAPHRRAEIVKPNNESYENIYLNTEDSPDEQPYYISVFRIF